MGKYNWIFIIQMNAESDLLPTMTEVFYEIKKNFQATSRILYAVILDGMVSTSSNGGTNPKLYYMDSRKEIHSPDEFFEFHDLSNSTNITTIIDKVYEDKCHGKERCSLAYFIKDHGGGMDLMTNNGIYKYKDVEYHGDKIKSEDIIVDISKKYKGNFKGFQIETVTRQSDSDKNLYRILYLKKDKELNYLTIADIGLAIQKSKFEKAEILCIDTCWGQMFENAYSVKDACNYFISNEDQGPLVGIGYGILTKYLNQVNQKMTTLEVVNAITASYILTNQQDYLKGNIEYRNMGVCLTAFRTKNLDALITLFDEIAQALIDLIDKHNKNTRKAITKARYDSFDFLYDGEIPPTDGEYPVYVIDLIHFFCRLNEELKTLLEEHSSAIRYKISDFLVLLYQNMIVEKNNYNDFEPNVYNVIAHGVSFFFPLSLRYWELSAMYLQPGELNTPGDQLPAHKKIIQSTKWPIFLKKYLGEYIPVLQTGWYPEDYGFNLKKNDPNKQSLKEMFDEFDDSFKAKFQFAFVRAIESNKEYEGLSPSIPFLETIKSIGQD